MLKNALETNFVKFKRFYHNNKCVFFLILVTK